jgi:hypothetical protein
VYSTVERVLEGTTSHFTIKLLCEAAEVMHRESTRCSRDTCPESNITEYDSIRNETSPFGRCTRQPRGNPLPSEEATPQSI